MNDGAPVSYGAEEAGKIIGQSANWMNTQARAGKIPYSKVGRKKRWTPAQLNEILREREVRPQAQQAVTRSPARRKGAKGDVPLLKGQLPKHRRTAA